MARIRGVTENEANEDVREVFEAQKKRHGFVSNAARYLQFGRPFRKGYRRSLKEFRSPGSLPLICVILSSSAFICGYSLYTRSLSVKLAGKVALITGTSPNIGGGIAEGLADEGAKVVACDIADLAQTESRVSEIGGEILDAIEDPQMREVMAHLVNETTNEYVTYIRNMESQSPTVKERRKLESLLRTYSEHLGRDSGHRIGIRRSVDG
jgi:hypothetical protein